MGRHTVPGTGRPTPDTGFWVRLTAAAVVALLVGGFFLVRQLGGDDTVQTDAADDGPAASAAAETTTSAPATTSPTSAAPATTAASPSATASPTPTKTGRPPTLSFVVLRKSYITVRVPGGRTLVSKAFPKGAERSFDQKVLEVVNGRPSAVRFTVNGKPRKPGDPTEPETFTVRRR